MAEGLYQAEFQNMMQKVAQLSNQIIEAINKIISNSNKVLRVLPGPLGNRLKSLLKDLLGFVQKLLSEVWKYYSNPGWPPSLFRAKQDWLDMVAKPADKLAGDINLNAMQVDDIWKGRSAKAYQDTLLPQQQALERVNAAAKEISSVLLWTASTIALFWAAMISILYQLVTELIGEAAAAGTVAGAPPAAAAAGVSVTKVLALVAAAVAAAGAAIASHVKKAHDLNLRLGESARNWPKSTNVTSDGSLVDGDGLDWSLGD